MLAIGVKDGQPDQALTIAQTALLLGKSPNALHVWRATRRGPRHQYQSGRIVYLVADIDDWLLTAPWTREVTPKALAAAKARGRARAGIRRDDAEEDDLTD
jgi:hypothetical protein